MVLRVRALATFRSRLLQRTRVLFPAPPRRRVATCNSNFGGSDALFWPSRCTYRHASIHRIKLKSFICIYIYNFFKKKRTSLGSLETMSLYPLPSPLLQALCPSHPGAPRPSSLSSLGSLWLPRARRQTKGALDPVESLEPGPRKRKWGRLSGASVEAGALPRLPAG